MVNIKEYYVALKHSVTNKEVPNIDAFFEQDWRQRGHFIHREGNIYQYKNNYFNGEDGYRELLRVMEADNYNMFNPMGIVIPEAGLTKKEDTAIMHLIKDLQVVRNKENRIAMEIDDKLSETKTLAKKLKHLNDPKADSVKNTLFEYIAEYNKTIKAALSSFIVIHHITRYKHQEQLLEVEELANGITTHDNLNNKRIPNSFKFYIIESCDENTLELKYKELHTFFR